MRRLNLALLAGALPLGLAVLAGPAMAECAAVDPDIRTALAAGNVAAYQGLYDRMTADPSCDGGYRDQVGRAMARSALTTLATDSDPATIDSGAAHYGRPWQVLVALGDAYYDRKDWPNAVKTYEEALDDMRDTVANPAPPPRDVEMRTYKRAVEAKALAPTYVATRQFRGQKTGLASPNFRNFSTEAVPVPVRFEYDSADLTKDGTAAVEDIYAYLQTAAPTHVVIIGHTDPQGSDSYNKDLSLRRADAVKAYLVHLGYTGTIDIDGQGESQPFTADDPSKYSEDELFAFDRRVEYKLN